MFAQVAVLALFIEAILTTVKWLKRDDSTFSIWNLVALILGIVITPMTGLDLFKAAGIPLTIPFVENGAAIGGIVGMVFTGMIVCRGSNVVYDLYKTINGLKDKLSSGSTKPLPPPNLPQNGG